MEYRKIVLWDTTIGSHIWKMNRPDSDIDRFVVFAYPTKIFLMGYNPKMSFFKQENGVDIHMHEIGAVINQLIKGNINFVLGTLSDMVNQTSEYHRKIAEIIRENPSKSVYHSIRGLAVHNYKKYIETGRDTSERRCDKILRVLQFGIILLREGRYEFKPYSGGTPEEIRKKIEELDIAYKESELPEKFPEEKLRNALYEIRYAFLEKI